MKKQSNNMRFLSYLLGAVAAVALIASCATERSDSTGWDYNNPRMGGFQKVPFVDQETGPGSSFSRRWNIHNGKSY